MITLHTDQGTMPPQSEVALPEAEAEALIEKGLAVAIEHTDSADSQPGASESELLDAIAVLSEDGFGKDGKPLVKALEDVLDRDITQAERDTAWKAYQAQ
jgi:hypothetical protein